ncbi:MAG: membrane protein [Phycisphaerae bacterium]|nr:MAG: membrane protein [Phycisphaerae bacterium]
MGSIFFTVAPLYVLIAIGAALRLAAAVDDNWIKVLNKYGLYLGFPAIVFSSLVKIPAGGMLETRTIACNILFLLVVVSLTQLIGRLLPLTISLRNTYVICVFYGNVAYLGFPFITSVTPGSNASISIHIAIYVAFLFTVGILMLELSKGRGVSSLPSISKNIITSPLLLSVVAGLLFRSTGLQLPLFIEQSVDLLASSAAPMVLLAIGMFMARRIKLDKSVVHVAILSSLKLIALPLCFILFARLASSNDAFDISIIEAGMPVGITVFALAEIYPLEKQIVASVIVMSTIFSAITLPILTGYVL